MELASTFTTLGGAVGPRSGDCYHALPDEVLAIFGQNEGLLVLSSSQDLGRRFTVHAGQLTYSLEALGRIDVQDLPIELLAQPDPSGDPCLLGPRGKYRVGWDLEEQWKIANVHTGYVEIDPSCHPFEVAYSNHGELRIPVKPGSTYVFSGYFAVHRVRSRVALRFFGPDGGLIDAIERPISDRYCGGREESCYHHIEMSLVAPPEARSAVLLLGYDGVLLPIDWPGYIYFANLSLRTAPADNASTLIAAHPKANLVREGSCQAYRAAIDFSAISQARSTLEIRSSKTVHIFYSLEETPQRDCELQLVGNCVSARSSESASSPTRLYIDNVFCCESLPSGDGRGQLYVIPKKCFDGGIHHMQVRCAYGIAVLAQDFLALPANITPWEVLQRECAPPLPSQLAPQAAHRYRSLQAHLADPRLHEDKWLLDNLMTLHGVLERGVENVRSFAPLRIREYLEPLVSIVIPAKDKAEVSYFCLCALIFAYTRRPFEIILVDDGSSDTTKKFPQIVEGLKYVRHEPSLGFVHACNRGAELATGEFIVFLNNDTEVTCGWLDELVDAFERHAQVGIAGSRLLYPSGLQQDAGGIIWGNGDPENYGRMENPADPRFSYVRQVDYISGAALMIRRSTWEMVGGFSDEYSPAYFEDTDLAFKVRELGQKTLYVPHSVVYHYEGLSGGTDVTAGTKRFQDINTPKFKRRWGHAFQGHGKQRKNVDLEKDRGVKGRALFIDAQTPRPDFDAGSYAAIQEMRLIQALGYKVTFVPQNVAYMGRYTDELQRLGVEVLYAPFYFSVHEVLTKRGEEFDLVYITRYEVAAQYVDEVRRYASRAKILFCNADLHFLRELRAAIVAKDSIGFEQSAQTREQELAVMRRVDLTLSYNEVEHAVILSHTLGAVSVAKCPWVVSGPLSVAPYEARTGVAFLGGYGHPPNIEAVESFAMSVMPKLRQAGSDIVFHVYGSRAPESLKGLEGPDVVIHGYVADVSEVYDLRRVFVAPLLSGAGIKGKVISAMAHGIPCVLSPIAAEGIGVRDGRECLIASSPEDWAHSVTKLYGDADLWASISGNARELVAAEYSFETGLKQMRSVLEAVELY